MKYFKCENEVYAFELDGSQDHLITEEHVAMTDEDVDRHINPHKYSSDEEKRTFYLASLRPLTRRQFKLTLLENGLLDQIENSISAIEDDQTRARIQIEYTEATEFHRTSDSVAYMCQLLGLTDEQVDQIWEHALTL
ncbi:MULTISPECIES: hypothetical protein [Acinetobacter]|uniref:hypothetical protein n=1 Tax=Acinetobacter TaxID=469 RepID=UPI0015B4B481|nr:MULTISPECIES: hypothetical protein [Acinetobacter]MBT0887560.1 hypothetical protein [Acinetobacter towneri]NWJ92967.1 hypothetical protein [Acinetobacter sp. Swhac1]